MLEVERKRHKSVALQFALLVQPPDLVLVGQQPAGPQRVAVEDVALLVGADVHAPHIELAVLHVAPGVLQVHLAHAQALHFGAHQFDAGLQAFHHEVLVPGLPVQGNGFGFHLFGHLRFLLCLGSNTGAGGFFYSSPLPLRAL